jgi:soluble lytic murein transglycosylase-like protein
MTTLVLSPTAPTRKAASWTFGLLLGVWVFSALIASKSPFPTPADSSLSPVDAAVTPVFDPAIAELEALTLEVERYRPDRSLAFHRSVATIIQEEAVAAGMDPFFVASLIGIESSFNPGTVSRAGAVGLMQIRPFVAEAVAASDPTIEWQGTETLRDPRANIRIGLLYYADLLETFNGDAAKALSAYNYGPTRVRRWVRKGSYQDTRYAKRILDVYATLSFPVGSSI